MLLELLKPELLMQEGRGFVRRSSCLAARRSSSVTGPSSVWPTRAMHSPPRAMIKLCNERTAGREAACQELVLRRGPRVRADRIERVSNQRRMRLCGRDWRRAGIMEAGNRGAQDVGAKSIGSTSHCRPSRSPTRISVPSCVFSFATSRCGSFTSCCVRRRWSSSRAGSAPSTNCSRC